MKRSVLLMALSVMVSLECAYGADLKSEVAGGGKPRDPNKPTTIASDKLEFDYKEFVALFDGSVHVDDQDFTLDADKMLVFFDGTNSVVRLDAVGNVRMNYDGSTAVCGKAVYTRSNSCIELQNEPVISQPLNNRRLGGKIIRVWLADERVEVEEGVNLSGIATMGKDKGAGEAAPKKREDAIGGAAEGDGGKPKAAE